MSVPMLDPGAGLRKGLVLLQGAADPISGAHLGTVLAPSSLLESQQEA